MGTGFTYAEYELSTKLEQEQLFNSRGMLRNKFGQNLIKLGCF